MISSIILFYFFYYNEYFVVPQIDYVLFCSVLLFRQDNVLNETTATCRTTESTAGITSPLVVFFDGAMRELQQMFTYKPNPTVKDVQPQKTILR